MAYHPGGPSVQGQLLEMTVVGCYKLSDKEWFSRQDPYVVIEYSGQKFRTRTDTDGGKNPSFNETFKFSLIDGLRDIKASVWNSNTIESDDYIGSTKIMLNKVIETGYDDSQWSLTNARTGKSSGMLKLILHYAGAQTRPATQAAHAAPGYYGQPAPAYSQPPQAHGPALSAYGSAHYPPQQSPMAYPPPGGYGAPPPVVAQPYNMSMHQAPAAPTYPPQYGSYGAPSTPPAVQPPYYPQASAPPYTGPPTYPSTTYPSTTYPSTTYPSTTYPSTGYPPSGYPQNRY